MGGLINSSTVKGDLWLIEAGANMACYPLATTAEGPGPRVGHSSLLVGNAFIVFGGDTKIEETDVLDETLYLLNTCKATARFLCAWLADTPQRRGSGQELCPPGHDPAADTATR
jgi:hypothetical protein